MTEVDVVVVGAGLAGLSAARDLTRKGLEVVVLEGRDRVGGRTFDQPLRNGVTVEFGGQWIGPTQDVIASLVDELDLETFPTYVHGEAWDIALFSMAYGTLASDVPFRDDDLTVLRDQFQAGPRTFGWATNFGGPGLTVYRFERAGQRVQVATHPQQTEWRLGADDGDLLAMLVDLLASTNQANEALARSLRLE